MGNPAIATDAAAGSKFTLGAAPGGAKLAATVVGPEASFRGDIKAKGDVTIAGTVEGEISSDGRINIAAGGTVTGRLSAAEIVIEGRLVGDATGTKSLTLSKSADLRGDISTPVITIEPGATFVGRCTMTQTAQDVAVGAKS